MTEPSSSFHLLDERIQKFIWAEGWEELRDAQEAAIPLIVKADRDVIIAAATAAGKTEAAFFPALTHLLQAKSPGLIVYISPLKALINDQFCRLERLCESLDIPVWPWHGDISATRKTRFLTKREGVLLITPESLEAMLCNRGSSVAAVFERTAFFSAGFTIEALHFLSKFHRTILIHIFAAMPHTTMLCVDTATCGVLSCLSHLFFRRKLRDLSL